MSIIPDKARIAALCRRFNVRRLELFGSAATGRFDPGHSDIDLLVEFAPMPAAAYAEAYFGLREALEAACGRPVDLVAGSALENPHLIRRIAAEKRRLYPSP
ncbi:MAG TPA: nucleotidyltransferase domain-containing protein [Stellaceae bacterium]|nr:nucleotidyltransferase domain-containing protein [Stellaceae bacterium]